MTRPVVAGTTPELRTAIAAHGRFLPGLEAAAAEAGVNLADEEIAFRSRLRTSCTAQHPLPHDLATSTPHRCVANDRRLVTSGDGVGHGGGPA